MPGSEFLATYPAKLMEYGLAVTYLVLFALFWKYVMGARRDRRLEEAAPRRMDDEAMALAAMLARGKGILHDDAPPPRRIPPEIRPARPADPKPPNP